jgi:hypothetical protein
MKKRLAYEALVRGREVSRGQICPDPGGLQEAQHHWADVIPLPQSLRRQGRTGGDADDGIRVLERKVLALCGWTVCGDRQTEGFS